MQPEEKRPFTEDEMHRICLAISDLHEFFHGYAHTKTIDEVPNSPAQLRLFMSVGLITYLHGFYPADRASGLLPILRLVGFNKLANDIEQALDTPIGPVTFNTILTTLRNKTIAHPQYRPELLTSIVEQDKYISDNKEAFRAADRKLKTSTAALFFQFRLKYPRLVAHTESITRNTDYS